MAARELLKQKGLRVTPQREAIYRLLAASKAHPTAEYVYQEISKVFPSISFNTVYKTMQTLEEAGLIQRFNTGENVYHYDANVTPHPHLICLSCGRVDDMEAYPDNLEDAICKAVRSSSYEIRSANLHFFGYCPQCGDNNKETHRKERY